MPTRCPRHNAAVPTRMKILRRRSDRQLKPAAPAVPGVNRRKIRTPSCAVGRQDSICGQPVAVCPEDCFERGATCFLLTLKQKADIDRQAAVDFEKCDQGLERDEQRALVVGGATRIDPAVPDRRLKRGRLPKLNWIRRLDIVVPIDKNCWRARSAKPLGIDRRLACAVGRIKPVDPLEPSLRQPIFKELSGSLHAVSIGWVRADRGMRDEVR